MVAWTGVRYTDGMSLPAIILAAGASRRLGQPKQLVQLRGETLLARTIRVTQEAGATPVCVVLGACVDSVLPSLHGCGVQAVINVEWEEGIATSIHAGLRWWFDHAAQASGVLLLVCDQLGLTSPHVSALLDSYAECASTCVVASVYAGLRGVPAIFPRSEFPNLLALRGDQGARRLLQHSTCPVIEVTFECGVIDIDTPEDLAEHISGFTQP
jgi:molybdenum cofactor cytidylyltransferase